jgi:hypothetical protein
MPEPCAVGFGAQCNTAVHRAYAKRALMKLPSLQEYEERAALGHTQAKEQNQNARTLNFFV